MYASHTPLLVSQMSLSDELLMQPANDVMQPGTRLDFLKVDQRGWLWAGSAAVESVFDGDRWSRISSRYVKAGARRPALHDAAVRACSGLVNDVRQK